MTEYFEEIFHNCPNGAKPPDHFIKTRDCIHQMMNKKEKNIVFQHKLDQFYASQNMSAKVQSK